MTKPTVGAANDGFGLLLVSYTKAPPIPAMPRALELCHAMVRHTLLGCGWRRLICLVIARYFPYGAIFVEAFHKARVARFRSVALLRSDRIFPAQLAQQMSGRAGRRGLDTQGNLLYMNMSWPKIQGLMLGDIPAIVGKDPHYPTIALHHALSGEPTLPSRSSCSSHVSV